MSDTKDTKKTEAPKAEEVKEEKDTVSDKVSDKVEKKAEAPKAKAPEKKVDTSLEDAEMAQELLESSVSEANVRSGGAGGRLTIREALMEYFSPTDLVTIKNPFDFNTGWVYSDPKDIKIEQPSAETRRVTEIDRDAAARAALERDLGLAE